MLTNGLERAVLASPARHQQPLRNQRWRLEDEGDRGVGGPQPWRKKLSFPAQHILFEGYISHTSNFARWARKQEMKTMYITASAGSNAHIKALYKTKLLYQYINSQGSEHIANVRA